MRLQEPFCPYFHHAVELIGRRWTGAIVRALQSGLSRFTEMTEVIPGLSDRMLSERLKELEAEGIVERRVIPETPGAYRVRALRKGPRPLRDDRRYLCLGGALARRPARRGARLLAGSAGTIAVNPGSRASIEPISPGACPPR